MKNLTLFLFALSIIVYSCTADGLSGSNYAAFGDTQNSEEEQYNDSIDYFENPFISTVDESTSTFAIDADGASYAFTRYSILNVGSLPRKEYVRTEEFLNYFQMNYDYESSEHPLSFHGEISECPWKEGNKLLRIGIKGKPLDLSEYGGSNFVFLIDVSGSMGSPDKIDLVKDGIKLLLPYLTEDDRISIVTYAGSFKTLLSGEKGTNTNAISKAIDKLKAEGSTNGSGGITTAYDIASENFIVNGNNRIIMATDGDFNLGITDQDELIELIEEEREQGVYLTALGVGGRHNAAYEMERLANNGNGTYEYLDNAAQLIKVFVVERSKFFAVAKDVKIQIDFNSNIVSQYRLIGYENRLLQTEDFEDDLKDAGELGADQDITAYYELIPQQDIDLKSEKSIDINLRYKLPDSDESVPLTLEVTDNLVDFDDSSPQHQFGASVIAFTMQLIDSNYKGTATYDSAIDWYSNSGVTDEHGNKSEFMQIVKVAKGL